MPEALEGWTVATFNVNSIRKRLPLILEWLNTHQPDILCLQETKVQDSEFPTEPFSKTPYHLIFRGMKAYNGVAILSREEPRNVAFGLDDGQPPDEARLISVNLRGVSIINAYVPQGFDIHSPKYTYKLEWFSRLREYFKRHFSPEDPVIWVGDMNVAPTPLDVHHPEDHEEHVCYHRAARQAYQSVVSWGFEDVFRKLHPSIRQYTFWDFRAPKAFERNLGWRLDHILATSALASRCTRADMDVRLRQCPEPSDHTVAWACFA